MNLKVLLIGGFASGIGEEVSRSLLKSPVADSSPDSRLQDVTSRNSVGLFRRGDRAV